MRAWVFVCLVAGCGGRTGPELTDGAPPDPMTVHDDAGDLYDAGDFPVCPAESPVIGSACTLPAGRGCAYWVRTPTSTWTREGFVCDKGGHWKCAEGGC